jgi:hypothetical protein
LAQIADLPTALIEVQLKRPLPLGRRPAPRPDWSAAHTPARESAGRRRHGEQDRPVECRRYREDMSEEIVFPADLTIERIDAFCDALHAELERQAAALSDVPIAERDLDRGDLRALFDGHGFGEDYQYLWVDWTAPVGELVSMLQAAEDEQLGSWRLLLKTYPSGRIDLGRDDYVSARPGDDWDPDD